MAPLLEEVQAQTHLPLHPIRKSLDQLPVLQRIPIVGIDDKSPEIPHANRRFLLFPQQIQRSLLRKCFFFVYTESFLAPPLTNEKLSEQGAIFHRTTRPGLRFQSSLSCSGKNKFLMSQS
jgi:hypothetical protein